MDKIFDSGDPPKIANEIHKLYDAIFQKKSDLLVLKEIEQLKTLCGHRKPVVNLGACNAVLRLVKSGRIDLSTAYSWLSSSILPAKNLSGLIQLAVDLFSLDLASSKGTAKPSFLKHSQQHPLVDILNHPDSHEASQFSVLVGVQSIFKILRQESHANGFELVKPVFEEIFSHGSVSVAFRNAAWDVLIEAGEIQQLVKFLAQFVCLTRPDAGFEYLHIVGKLLEKASDPEIKSLLVSLTPCVASVVQHLVKYGILFEGALALLETITQRSEQTSSLALMILAETVPLCSTRHLSSLLNTCLKIMRATRCSTISEHMLVASLIRWLIQPTAPTPEFSEIASAIICTVFSRKGFYHSSIDFRQNYWFLLLSSSHKTIQKSVFLHRLSENLSSKENCLTAWLDSVNTKFEEFTLFLCSLLISSEDRVLKERVIGILSKLKQDQHLATLVFQLSREKDPKIQSKLLLSMHLCIDKDNQENKMIVLQILKGLSSSTDLVLREQSIYLYFLFWKVERRCFPFLHTLLVSNDVSSYEIDITKAKVIKEICKLSPEIYGKNVARPVADILNKAQATQPCVLALNSVTLLCRAGEIDVRSTWNAIKPKFINEKRPEIIEGLCEILSVVPSFYCQTDAEQQDFLAEVVTTLWSFVTSYSNDKVTSAALRAFANFSLEHLSLETLPDVYKENAEKAIRTSLANSVAEFVHVPGKCWLNMLESLPTGCHDAAAALFTKWLSDEMATFHSGIYSKVLEEPSTYTFLQERSLCRTFVDYVRKHSTLPITESAMPAICLCLRILSGSRPKPLPPLKWTFLSNYMNEGTVELKIYATKLAIKQATHKSSSAIHALEAKLSNFDFCETTENEIIEILEDFNGVYRSVHPTIHQSFMNKSFQYATEQVKQNKTRFYCALLDSVRSFLAKGFIESDNFVSKIIHDEWTSKCNIPGCSESLIRCISVLSDQLINAIFPPPESNSSSLTSSSNLHSSHIKLICQVASIKLTTESIDRMINLMRVVCTKRFGVDHRVYLQNELLPIFALPIPRVTVLFFVKGLMGLVENCQDEDLEYLCAILLRVMIVYTGLSYSSTKDYSNLPLHSLPFALAHFVQEETLSFREFFENILMNKAHEMNISYSILFRQCLISLNNFGAEHLQSEFDYISESFEKNRDSEKVFLKVQKKTEIMS